ncbi:unnamed protein product [Brassica oleracea var. botrytis]
MSINVDRGYQLGEQWNPTDLFPQHYIYLYINLVQSQTPTLSAILQCLRARETP